MTPYVRLLSLFCTLALGCAGKSAEPPADPSGGPGGYDPCGGKTCGDICTLCAPDDADCDETAESKVCDAAGTCVSDTPDLVCEGGDEPAPPPSGEYDPCGGKACSDSCSLCAPDDADCVETAVVKQCDAAGACSSSPASCG